MNELRKYLIRAFARDNPRRWQDVIVPAAFIEKANQIGLSQEETFNFAINTWNKYVRQQLTYQPVRINNKK